MVLSGRGNAPGDLHTECGDGISVYLCEYSSEVATFASPHGHDICCYERGSEGGWVERRRGHRGGNVSLSFFLPSHILHFPPVPLSVLYLSFYLPILIIFMASPRHR